VLKARNTIAMGFQPIEMVENFMSPDRTKHK